MIAGLAIGLPIGLSGSRGHGGARTPTSTTAVTPPSTSTSRVVLHGRCPLTDLPVKSVPRRPALLVKIGNEPYGARPQSGLDEADIVFDTPAEGFIMRYIAVYQCEDAPSIGPTRSLRWVDWHLARAFPHPILAFAGGINPDVNTVDSFGWLYAANLLEGAQGAATRISSRVPPDNLYTNTSALYALAPEDHSVPPSIFHFEATPPSGGNRTASFSINFSYGTDVIWRWDPKLSAWVHTYSGATDIDAWSGRPVTAANVVICSVSYSFGPYIESPGGTGDVESVTTGSGPGYVLRNGQAWRVTWHRPSLSSGFTFTDAAGNPVPLAPGRTFVELAPDGTAMSPSR